MCILMPTKGHSRAMTRLAPKFFKESKRVFLPNTENRHQQVRNFLPQPPACYTRVTLSDLIHHLHSPTFKKMHFQIFSQQECQVCANPRDQGDLVTSFCLSDRPFHTAPKNRQLQVFNKTKGHNFPQRPSVKSIPKENGPKQKLLPSNLFFIRQGFIGSCSKLINWQEKVKPWPQCKYLLVTIPQCDTLDFKWLGGLLNASLNGNFIALRGKDSGIFCANV